MRVCWCPRGEGVIIADQIILDTAPLLIGISNSSPELTVELNTAKYTALDLILV